MTACVGGTNAAAVYGLNLIRLYIFKCKYIQTIYINTELVRNPIFFIQYISAYVICRKRMRNVLFKDNNNRGSHAKIEATLSGTVNYQKKCKYLNDDPQEFCLFGQSSFL